MRTANTNSAGMIGKVTRLGIVAALLGVAWLALASSPAGAAYKHNVIEKTFNTTCALEDPQGTIDDIAVHEATQTIYVFCANVGEFGQQGMILKYNYNGQPVEFGSGVPYVNGNAITANPASPTGSLGRGFSGSKLSVDNSGGQSDGYIYVVSGGSGNLDVFKPNGEYSASKVQPYCAGNPYDVHVGPDGFVYFAYSGYCARISKYTPTLTEVGRFHIREKLENAVFGVGSKMTADNTGALWIIGGTQLFKVEGDQFATSFPVSPLGTDMDSIEFEPSPDAPYPFLQGTNVFAPEVDVTNNDLYVNRGNRIETYSQGTPEEAPYKKAPDFGTGLENSRATAVTKDHRVFATTKGTEVVRFGAGDVLPDVTTLRADIDEIGHFGATLRANIDLAGGGPVTACELRIGTNTSYSLPPVPCSPAPPYAGNQGVSATIGGLTTGQLYHYNFKVTNANGTNEGIDRTFTPAFVLKVQTLPATGIEENKATLQGSFDPDGISTEYWFQYGVTTAYGQETGKVVQGSAPGEVVVGSTLTGLPAGKVFNYRILAKNVNGTTTGPNLTFRTASTPDVTGLTATDLSETSAVLHAKVNPVGYSTKYHFEYGPTPEYGTSIPIPDEALGAGTTPVDVEEKITGLQPGITYHYRVVAENQWGKAFSSDTTFDFAPPACPNEHVRQQTGSAYLPDCRAYELVSPPSAGAVQLYPGKEVWDLVGGTQDPYAGQANWIQNDGLATSPSRLTFVGLAGTIDGLRAPNVLSPDFYMATRSNEGWTTTLPGIDDSLGIPYGKQCSDSMDLCIDHSSDLSGTQGNTAPYLFTYKGEFRGRLPTNLNIVKGGINAVGYKRLSGDFSHFAFSSREYGGFPGAGPGAVFAPGGTTTGAGSAYDNNLRDRTVELISKTQAGTPIPQNGSNDLAIEFPGVSTDGTHILMSTRSQPSGPYKLYMRVGGGKGVTYDITQGSSEAAEFVGMTRDGREVLFTTDDSLEAADVDTSIDLYAWREAGDTLTRISQAPVEEGLGKEGNKDVCGATWTNKCNVLPLNPERRFALTSEVPFGNPGVPHLSAPGVDDVFADGSGDVYFYSPEQLDPDDFGIPGERNLYLYRDGEIQLVTIFDTGTQIERMQISANGSHAAMLTKSQLTSYENDGFSQVYTYDVETGAIRCASCLPSGQPPSAHAVTSLGGPFMADDGRTFFTTRDRLVPRDNNGTIFDVYEYVDGRPQLISSGLGARDFTGQAEVLGLFTVPQFTGLEAVSADGSDVYFSTFDTLVKGDLNGEFVKFYDARTGGGFPDESVIAPCAAADECHGVDSAAPPQPPVVSANNLGDGGNVKSEAKKKKKKKKKKKNKRKRSRRGNG